MVYFTGLSKGSGVILSFSVIRKDMPLIKDFLRSLLREAVDSVLSGGVTAGESIMRSYHFVRRKAKPYLRPLSAKWESRPFKNQTSELSTDAAKIDVLG